MKQDLLVLMLSYPDSIINILKEDNNIYLLMKDKSKILYDDHKTKDESEKYENADLQDTLEIYYPLDKNNQILSKNYNPGRIRNYTLLKSVYGLNKTAIEKNLKSLKNYSGYTFNGMNNAASELDNVFKELKSKHNPSISSLIYPCSGTYNYRLISGTNRLSPHSFGIAIDIKSDSRDYHKWSTPEKGSTRLKEYPEELVKTFENHNFIWGGKWGYFDILHFEYRPEIILKAKYFTNYDSSKEWYQDIDINNTYTKECIQLINDAVK